MESYNGGYYPKNTIYSEKCRSTYRILRDSYILQCSHYSKFYRSINKEILENCIIEAVKKGRKKIFNKRICEGKHNIENVRKENRLQCYTTAINIYIL